MLWDLGLKVGHATRSLQECLRLAREDMTIRTGLLESRYLWGDDKLYAELDRIIKLPDVNKQMEARGFDPVSYTPEQFTEHVKKEMKKWPPVFKAAGIKVNN